MPRIAAEAAFLIAVAVFLGVAGYGAVTVVLAMAAAWLVVIGIESVLLRERRAAAEPPRRGADARRRGVPRGPQAQSSGS